MDSSYSRRLFLEGGSFLTRYAHRRRLEILRDLLYGRTFPLALDYGCADGWILRDLLKNNRISRGVGVDLDREMVERARKETLEDQPLTFYSVNEIPLWGKRDGYPLILCLETLEHVGEPFFLLSLFYDLLEPGGTLILSVPIEIGPSLLLKQIGRFLTHRIRGYGYERYRWLELFWGALGRVERIPSSHQRPDLTYKGHKGFDYRWIEEDLKRFFPRFRKVYSPFPPLGSWFNATIFYVAEKEKKTLSASRNETA
jgi:SAM-dependent methyltransferase